MTASTQVMETGLKYYIDAIGRSSYSVQLTVSGSNYRAAAACKESEGDQWMYWMNYWATSNGGRGRCVV